MDQEKTMRERFQEIMEALYLLFVALVTIEY